MNHRLWGAAESESLLFVVCLSHSESSSFLNPALLDMAASTHSDNQMKINYNPANNNGNIQWIEEKSCQFSQMTSLWPEYFCTRKNSVVIYLPLFVYIQTKFCLVHAFNIIENLVFRFRDNQTETARTSTCCHYPNTLTPSG